MTTVYATGFHLCIYEFKDVSAPLESICHLGPHALYIKEIELKQARCIKKKKNGIKPARLKKKKEKKKRTTTKKKKKTVELR